MITTRRSSFHSASLALGAAEHAARSGFACLFSTSDEYEAALIAERRAQGRYAVPNYWPFVLLAGAGFAIAVTILLSI